MKLLSRLSLIAAVGLLAGLPARAQQVDAAEVEVGESLVCDTQEQAERFVALFSGDTGAAAKIVNEEQKDPTACAIVTTAHLRGNEIGTARSGTGFYFRVVRILVVGVVTDNGLQAAVPSAFYAVDKLEDRDA